VRKVRTGHFLTYRPSRLNLYNALLPRMVCELRRRQTRERTDRTMALMGLWKRGKSNHGPLEPTTDESQSRIAPGRR
jgi:hypothetical protein